MNRFYKTISTLLHPTLVPTITVFLYLILLPKIYDNSQKIALLGIVFITTYLIPILIHLLFKKVVAHDRFKPGNINHRKIRVGLMIILFYLLAQTIASRTNILEFSLLFYATSGALTFVYLLFTYQINTSIHLLSLGLSAGFFIVLATEYNQNFLIVIIINILLAGLVATARLSLKEQKPLEIYLGFFLGFTAPFVAINFL